MTTLDGKLRHLAFFEELGRMDESDDAWRAVSAGLVVMRLVDRWAGDGPMGTIVDSWAVNAVREAVLQVAETTPMRRILTSIVDVLVAPGTRDMHTLCPRLMAYGQSLEYEARWSLAADVYGTIIEHTNPVEDADLAVAAHIQSAFCLRTLGDLEAASAAYANASRVAYAAGDLIGVLRGRLGDAKIAMARGNMPHAESILEETINRAGQNGLQDVRARALGDRAYIAGLRGDHEVAIRYAYDALEISPGQRQRDRILSNIATGFHHLGLLDVARDAYLVLAATAQEQYVRWMAELNLMELAAEQQVELQFDKYRRDLDSADFTPLLQVTYLLHVGRGYHHLGRADAGIPYLERAIHLASHHQLNQLLFEAEEALTQARQHEVRVNARRSAPTGSEIGYVIDAIAEMKEAAGV